MFKFIPGNESLDEQISLFELWESDSILSLLEFQILRRFLYHKLAKLIVVCNL